MDLSRKIYLIGDIDNESFKSFSRKLARLESESRTDTVYIELVSDGGSAYSALAFYDRIELSPCPIHVCAMGLVASAAALVLAAGDVRVMTPSAWLMVHEDTPDPKEFEDRQVHEIETRMKHYRRLETQWANLLARTTTTGDVDWSCYHKEETYLNPQQCLELGIIDKILEIK